MATRESWGSPSGFILAAVGSAVGLGNMWRFSYMTAEKGGAAFVGLYILFTLLIGLPVLMAELAIGRGSQKSPIQALAHYGGAGWRPLGVVFVATGFLVLSYYGVIAGWTLRYVGAALTGSYSADPAAYFAQVSQGSAAFGFHLLFMAATIGIVSGGISRGIERVAGVMMPLLFALVIGIALYAASLEGASAGYRYYMNTNFANVLEADVIVSAAGQAFFSLSLGMGAMLTFASYLSREHDLPKESVIIATADFGVAFLAGLMVFPLIFALGLEASVINTVGTENEVGTLGALFVALPKAFSAMGGVGRLVGVAFFVALLVGALTSAISLLEVVVSAVIDGLGWARTRAAWVLGSAVALLGAPSAWNIGFLDVADQVANNVLLVGGALALSIFAGWVADGPADELRGENGEIPVWHGAWRFMLRFVAPAVLIFVLAHSLPATWANLVALLGG